MEGITLEPLASANAVLSQEEKEAGVALIDIGGGTTDLAIFKDGIIRPTAVISFGGNVITEDIKEGFKKRIAGYFGGIRHCRQYDYRLFVGSRWLI